MKSLYGVQYMLARGAWCGTLHIYRAVAGCITRVSTASVSMAVRTLRMKDVTQRNVVLRCVGTTMALVMVARFSEEK